MVAALRLAARTAIRPGTYFSVLTSTLRRVLEKQLEVELRARDGPKASMRMPSDSCGCTGLPGMHCSRMHLGMHRDAWGCVRMHSGALGRIRAHGAVDVPLR